MPRCIIYNANQANQNFEIFPFFFRHRLLICPFRYGEFMPDLLPNSVNQIHDSSVVRVPSYYKSIISMGFFLSMKIFLSMKLQCLASENRSHKNNENRINGFLFEFRISTLSIHIWVMSASDTQRNKIEWKMIRSF